MIRCQRCFVDNQEIWLVIGDDHLPISPIHEYITHLHNLERSPNTVRNYAHHLALYWRFLKELILRWDEINPYLLGQFIRWLRSSEQCPTAKTRKKPQIRSERTVNTILSAVLSFYDFQARVNNFRELNVYGEASQLGTKFKSFLYGIANSTPDSRSLLKLDEPKKLVGRLTSEEVAILIQACTLLRDKFLLCLLHETGLRIGEALGLRHEDMIDCGENKIRVLPRYDNVNRARVKDGDERFVDVTQDLMRLYSDYLIQEYPDIDCDYVFVTVDGRPLTYSAVNSLFRRLKEKTGIDVHAHLFRHTHASDLIVVGEWDAAYVQERLGHQHVQTTIDTYVHFMNEDMKKAYQKYLKNRDVSDDSK